MKAEKILPLIKGMIIHLPGTKQFILKYGNAGNAYDSNYCYTVWFRHFKNLMKTTDTIPKVVAELGSGDSLGTALCALLCGSEKIYSLEVYKYWDIKQNLRVFEELVQLFKQRKSIPTKEEYPLVVPELEDYTFPKDILTDELFKVTLAEDRLDAIRKELKDIDNPNNKFLRYYIPWNSSTVIQKGSVDFIFSQGVLQSVEDVEDTYTAMKKWLKPQGKMSHLIDFRSLKTSPRWNGHWTFSDREWKIIKGGRPFLTNRQPYSRHIGLHHKYGFNILHEIPLFLDNTLETDDFAPQFKYFNETDRTTSLLYILGQLQ